MFITEQQTNQDIHKRARKGLFKTGMPLANPKHVNLRFTYKEFTLVLGIFVALIIAFTVLANQKNMRLYPENAHSPKLTIPLVQEIVKKSISAIWF